MDEITKEYALRALNKHIERLSEHVEWQKKRIKEAEKALKTKQGITTSVGGFGVSMQYDESFSSREIKSATEKLEYSTPHLEKYIHARDNILKM